ncbi:MAG: GMC oxidoreductase, partial [Pseudomonadota bacterium]
SVDVAAGRAQGLNWRRANAEGTTKTDHAVLGANGLFNPEILLRSGDPSPLTGRRLHEQVGIVGQVLLDGVDSFQGTTNISGIGYMLYDNDDRRQSKAAALLETKSVGRMRADPGRWRQVLPIRLVIEDMPDEVNLVRITPDSDKPVAEHNKISDYAQRAVDSAEVDLAEVFQKLPVERIEIKGFAPTESHIQGTTVMGHDPTSSVTDADGLHHRWGDLRILGSSLFPTGAAANPTLTIAAHAIRAAERMEL